MHRLNLDQWPCAAFELCSALSILACSSADILCSAAVVPGWAVLAASRASRSACALAMASGDMVGAFLKACCWVVCLFCWLGMYSGSFVTASQKINMNNPPKIPKIISAFQPQGDFSGEL